MQRRHFGWQTNAWKICERTDRLLDRAQSIWRLWSPIFSKICLWSQNIHQKIIGKQEQQNKRSKSSSGQKYKLASNLSSRGIEHETCICYAGHFRQPNIMDRAKKPEQNLDFLNLNEKKIKCVSSSSSDQKSMNFEQFTWYYRAAAATNNDVFWADHHLIKHNIVRYGQCSFDFELSFTVWYLIFGQDPLLRRCL